MTNEVRALIERSVGSLERALAAEHPTGGLGADLQLRYSHSGIATESLKTYLFAARGIKSAQFINRLKPIADEPSIPIEHVILRAGDLTIDPTYSQFLHLVGLNPYAVSQQPELNDLYPVEKIAVFQTKQHQYLVDKMASHALFVAANTTSLQTNSGVLAGASATRLREVFSSIWNPASYKLFSAKNQTLNNSSAQIADRMLQEQFPRMYAEIHHD